MNYARKVTGKTEKQGHMEYSCGGNFVRLLYLDAIKNNVKEIVYYIYDLF